jgi:hypothetical protein
MEAAPALLDLAEAVALGPSPSWWRPGRARSPGFPELSFFS